MVRERKKFLLRGRSTVKNKERDGGRGVKILVLFPPLSPTVRSNSNSNMAGPINNRKLITLPRTNKTPTRRLRFPPNNNDNNVFPQFFYLPPPTPLVREATYGIALTITGISLFDMMHGRRLRFHFFNSISFTLPTY